MVTERSPRNHMPRRHLAAGMLAGAALAICSQQAAATLPPAEQGPKTVAQGGKVMVSSSHPLVTQAMLKVLRDGGNALDAAITATILQGVVEPQMTTIAGAMAMMYYDAASGQLYHLDAEVDHTREDAPTTLSSTWISRSEPAGLSRTSGRRVAVPGTVAGLHAAHARFGSMKWADYFTPAIETAERGFPMYSFLYGEMADAAQGRLSAYRSGREEFLPDGFVPPVGATVKRPRLAQAMKKLAAQGPDWFYRGEWAQRFVDEVRKVGGGISLQDLADYRARWNEPVRSTYHGYEIAGSPPPGTGGALISMVLNILEPFDLKAMPPPAQSAQSFALVRKAFMMADFNTEAYIRDPHAFNVPMDRLMSKEFSAVMSRLIDSSWPRGVPAVQAAVDPARAPTLLSALETEAETLARNTNHLVAVDEAGNWVSLSHTVNGGTFAIGLVVDGILTNAANAFPGTGQGEGRRSPGPLPPSLVLKDGKPYMAIGSPGLSSRAVAQVLVNHLGFGMSMPEAIDAPRFSGAVPGTPTLIENRLAPQVLDALAGFDIPVKLSAPYNWHLGSIHAVMRTEEGKLLGFADPRRGGVADGY